jgi:hypothetical protein
MAIASREKFLVKRDSSFKNPAGAFFVVLRAETEVDNSVPSLPTGSKFVSAKHSQHWLFNHNVPEKRFQGNLLELLNPEGGLDATLPSRDNLDQCIGKSPVPDADQCRLETLK